MKRSFNAATVPISIALESVEVASPCHADWDAMSGDDRSRFCPSCAKNVYNLSAMTRVEAELLLQEKEGRLCVRFFQREDGTMLTQDCPVGVAALKERSPSFALWAGVASLLVLMGALLSPSFVTGAHAQPEPSGGETPVATQTPLAEPPVFTRMGDAMAPSATVAPTVQPTATATPVFESLGEMKAPVAPHNTPVPTATAKPTPPTSRMGKIAMPTATPVAPPVAVLGRMVHIPSPQSTATPVPAVKKAPLPMMGLVVRVPSTSSHPPKKLTSTPKKRKTSAKKGR